LPSIQVNLRAGKFPPAHANGVRYLTIPVKFKDPRQESAEPAGDPSRRDAKARS
jgi:hypothetical protein